MSKYTKEDLIRMIEEEDVEFVRLQFTDIFGTLKNVAVTTSQLERALNNRVMFDGSAIEGFVGVEKSDLYLYPDLDTFTIFPWRPSKSRVARLICDVYYPDEKPFEGDSRYILKKVLADARKDGYKFLAGPECEFFLFQLDDNGMPTTRTSEKAGYFDVSPSDLGENARRDIVLNMEAMGFPIEASHHESARGQHEVDIHYQDALKSADTITTFRLAARTIARNHGLCATFMPKPLRGEQGSGMHINLSMIKDGINIFENPSDPFGLSREAYWFIGGLMKHIRGMTAVLNPLVNSYKRLISGDEAPSYVAWSQKNRSMLIRVPADRGFNTRLELRSPDPSANPYLTLALCIAAGMDGVRNQIMPPEAARGNLNVMGQEEIEQKSIERLPGNLGEALEAMKEDSFVYGVLGEHIAQKFIKKKEAEWAEYSAEVTSWETDRYLADI